MSSYGIVGINPNSLKVIRDMQQFKNISVYDKYKTNLTPFKNVKMQPTVADLTLNMNGPRTIATFINPDDYGYENIFYRQIESLGRKGDVLFAITTSGKSKNILKILQLSRKKGIKVILLTSKKAVNLKNKVDLLIPAPSERVDRIQEMHIAIGQIICEIVENCIN